MLKRLRTVHDILRAEYVDKDWYAHWKMRLWRRKRSVLMQFYASVVRKVSKPGQPVLFGSGDGGFAAMGKGERPVPTSGARAELRRTLRSMTSRNPGRHTYLDETGTTKCCATCGSILRTLHGDENHELHGIRVCAGCTDTMSVRHWHRLETGCVGSCSGCGNQKLGEVKSDGCVVGRLKLCTVPSRMEGHTVRLLNRDVNAAKNLLRVLVEMVHGRPRPAYLVRGRARSQRARFPQQVVRDVVDRT